MQTGPIDEPLLKDWYYTLPPPFCVIRVTLLLRFFWNPYHFVYCDHPIQSLSSVDTFLPFRVESTSTRNEHVPFIRY